MLILFRYCFLVTVFICSPLILEEFISHLFGFLMETVAKCIKVETYLSFVLSISLFDSDNFQNSKLKLKDCTSLTHDHKTKEKTNCVLQARSQKFAMGSCFGGLGAEPPALENLAFFCKNNFILGLF